MSSIIDDISPDDAADANDPGRGNIFTEPNEKYWITDSQYNNQDGTKSGYARASCCWHPLEGLLPLAILDYDKWNVLKASIPLTLGASSEALFRLIIIAFISQKLGTDSMIGACVDDIALAFSWESFLTRCLTYKYFFQF